MQMRYVLLPFLGALCLALAACSVTYGNKSVASPEVYGRLAPGKSSKADVYDALGQPSDVVTMKTASCGPTATTRLKTTSWAIFPSLASA